MDHTTAILIFAMEKTVASMLLSLLIPAYGGSVSAVSSVHSSLAGVTAARPRSLSRVPAALEFALGTTACPATCRRE